MGARAAGPALTPPPPPPGLPVSSRQLIANAFGLPAAHSSLSTILLMMGDPDGTPRKEAEPSEVELPLPCRV